MTHRFVTRLGIFIAGLLIISAVPASPANADEGPARDLVDETGSSSVVAKTKANKGFFPRRGVTFNNPIGNRGQQYAIYNKLINSIRSTPRGGYIRIMSWNVYSVGAVDALLAAQRRGVKIRVLMDDSNRTEIPNPSWNRLVGGLRGGNKGRPYKKRSFAKTCQGSCRGNGGQAHAKFFLFSKTGRAKKVFMQGSANLTGAAGINQWNDLYTFVGNKSMYNFGLDVFNEMWKDRPVKRTYVRKDTPNGTMIFSPWGGQSYPGDPVQKLLNDVRCKGARNGAGTASGSTIVRVAPDVMRHKRGRIAAQRLREMWNNGCDVKIAYTVLSYEVSRILRGPGRRGPVPLRHLVQDFDGDGDFDNYFHLKSLTVNGRVDKNRKAYVTVNGSSNMSGVASVSDENIGIFAKRNITLKYQNHIDYWFNNAPTSRVVPGARIEGIDPYANIDMD